MKHLHTLLATAVVTSFMLVTPATAGEIQIAATKDVTRGAVKRVKRICDKVVPAWIKSKSGLRDKSLRRLAVDCYTEQARLPLIGVPISTLDLDVVVVELPLALLEKATGLKFDVYAPLSGLKIRVRNVRTPENE